MKPNELKVGDRIRIVGLPRNYPVDLNPDTKRVLRKLISRRRPVTIDEIDEHAPWYSCRFRMKNGKLEDHSLAVCDGDDNWVLVKRRRQNGNNWVLVKSRRRKGQRSAPRKRGR
jgi:hypothetical protein